ncbi:NAD(P)-binding protein [Mycena venus]|uniref:NAD(P)-binding protein n=1 Tax=Mycena venus TaxID=2733690 RepID=A0A8H7CN55_9AGAR|nr:NAD(P)-binding protein [Mycena venus]
MFSKIVYLISGANRGIGYVYSLASALAAHPNTIVFAGAQDPVAQTLMDLTAKYPNVYLVKLTSADKTDNEAAILQIEKIAGQLDAIIANADDHFGPLVTTPLHAFHEHFQVNTLGPVVLFQAAHTLLLASPTGEPIFAVISSAIGSLGRFLSITATPYGMSKAAANFLVKTLDAEHPSLITIAIESGWVSTDMGNAPVKIDDSIAGVLSRVNGATKEKSSGKFWNFKVAQGNPWDIETKEVPW